MEERRSDQRVRGDQGLASAGREVASHLGRHVGGGAPVEEKVGVPAARQARGRRAERFHQHVPEPRPVGHGRHALRPQALRPCRGGPSLRPVARDHPPEGALAGGLDVHRDLVPGAEVGLNQVDGRARGRDLQDAGLVGDRQRESRRSGVEVPYVRDRGRVLGGPASVGRRDRAAPSRASCRGRRCRPGSGREPRAPRPSRGRRRAPAAPRPRRRGRSRFRRPAQRHADVDGHVLAGLDSSARRGAPGYEPARASAAAPARALPGGSAYPRNGDATS